MLGHWAEVRADPLRAVDSLADEDLCFVPREGLWSLDQVLCHIAGAERGWFRVIRGEEPGRFGVDASGYPTVEAVKGLLADIHEQTLATLGDLDVADLSREVATPWGSRVTIGWIIWHVLEHEIHHRGEVFLMIGLLGREAPDI
jgi:uncharacterized damage-inducible protein DinB